MLCNTPQVAVNSWVGLEKQRFNYLVSWETLTDSTLLLNDFSAVVRQFKL